MLLFSKGRRTGKQNADGIIAGMQVFLHIHYPSAVHIVCRQNRMVIQKDLSNRIQSMKDQLDMLMFQLLLLQRKCAAVCKIIMQNFQRLCLIIPIIRVLHQSVSQQIGADSARNLSRICTFFAALRKTPFFAERNCLYHNKTILSYRGPLPPEFFSYQLSIFECRYILFRQMVHN